MRHLEHRQAFALATIKLATHESICNLTVQIPYRFKHDFAQFPVLFRLQQSSSRRGNQLARYGATEFGKWLTSMSGGSATMVVIVIRRPGIGIA